MEKQRILITGGAGFIGSHLVEALLTRGAEVIVLDNFMTGKRENVAVFSENASFRLIEGDIRDFELCRKAVEGCDAVLHEAALGSVPRSMENPQLSFEVNVQGFCNVIEAARRAGVKRFVFASSSSVYGDEPTLPKSEERVGRVLSPYALTKRMNEETAELYGRVFGLETIGLRYFNVFGARQDPAGAYAAVIPKFVSALLRHTSPVINGAGTISRDFTFVDNVVQANLLALGELPDAAFNECYNIAFGDETTLDELFLELRTALGSWDAAVSAIPVCYGTARPGDIPHSLARTEKARKLLGYAPEVDVRSGLRKTAEWYYRNWR